jgi:hypothetical protein
MKNRYMRGGLKAADTTARSAARVTKVLWLEVIGAACAIFAISFAAKLWTEYQNRATTENPTFRISAAGLVLAIFAWFAVSSFWRARKLKQL